MELLTVNNVWMMVCTALVFFMHLGFSFLEIGLTRQKNTINILFKNFFVITAGLIIYCLIGFNLMYPGEWIIEGVIGTIVPGLDSVAASDLSYNEGYTYWTDFLFQGMFAATAATIISGAVAERIKINSFILIAILYVTIVYPIVGSWQWGGGFFSTFISDELGFYDFAGSTLVHSVGGRHNRCSLATANWFFGPPERRVLAEQIRCPCCSKQHACSSAIQRDRCSLCLRLGQPGAAICSVSFTNKNSGFHSDAHAGK